jgi:hypothetical protein
MRQEVSERKERDEIERRMVVEEASKKKFETVCCRNSIKMKLVIYLIDNLPMNCKLKQHSRSFEIPPIFYYVVQKSAELFCNI